MKIKNITFLTKLLKDNNIEYEIKKDILYSKKTYKLDEFTTETLETYEKLIVFINNEYITIAYLKQDENDYTLFLNNYTKFINLLSKKIFEKQINDLRLENFKLINNKK